MKKRKYTKVDKFSEEILAMREAGKTRQEIADQLGLEKEQIKGWIKRYNRKEAKRAAGIIPRPKGRPRTKIPESIEDYRKENERLKMENELLRDFLRSIGRK